MFEGIKSIFLNGKIKYKELQEVEKQIEFRSSIFEKEKKFIESSYLDALRDTDESNWTSLNVKDNRELPEAARVSLIDQADLMYYRNGHFRNIIKLFVKYTVGRGFQILPDCIDPIVKEFWDNIYDINRMKKRAKETVNRLHRHGEVFIRRFPQKDGTTLFRFMDPRLIRDPKEGANEHTTYGIETDPDDIENILYFYYDGEKIPAEEVIYEKIDVDSNVKRGRCKCEPIMEELAMYKGWMRDRMKLNKLRSMVGIVRKVTGSPTQVQNIANQNQTTKRIAPDNSSYMRSPEGISMVTVGKNVDWDFKTPNLQAADVQNDGRALLLEISAGVGLPEYMVTSDASNSNYASTMVAEAPGVQEFVDAQESVEWVFQQMFFWSISWAIECGVIPENIDTTETVMETDPVTGLPISIEKTKREKTKKTCTIVFPEIVHRDILQETNALILQIQNGLCSERTASGKLDHDYEVEQKQIKIEQQEKDQNEYDTARNNEIQNTKNKINQEDQNTLDQLPKNPDEANADGEDVKPNKKDKGTTKENLKDRLDRIEKELKELLYKYPDLEKDVKELFKKQPVINNITLPEQKPHEVNVTNNIAEQKPTEVNITNNIPEQKQADIKIMNENKIPEQKQPIVNVTNNIPEQKQPIVNVNVEETKKPLTKKTVTTHHGDKNNDTISTIIEEEIKENGIQS